MTMSSKTTKELQGIIDQLSLRYLYSLLGCARGLLKAQEKEKAARVSSELTKGNSALQENMNNGDFKINEQFDKAFLESMQERIMKLSPVNRHRAEVFISGLLQNAQ